MNFLKGWKTYIVNILMAVVPLLDMAEVKQIVPVEYMPYYAIFMVIMNLILREMTDTPARGKK